MTRLKKALKYILLFLSALLVLIITGAVILFFKPSIIINEKGLRFALEKSQLFKEWSWKKVAIHHKYLNWNERHFSGQIDNFCFVYQKPFTHLDSCLDLSWDVFIDLKIPEGVSYRINRPFEIVSAKTNIMTRKDPHKKKVAPPDIMHYWDLFWGPLVPDIKMKMTDIKLTDLDKKKDNTKELSFELSKKGSSLNVNSMGFNLNATPRKVVITGPEKILLPVDLKTKNPLYFTELRLVAFVEKTVIPVEVTARIEDARLNLTSTLKKETLKENFRDEQFLRDILVVSKAKLSVAKINSTIQKLMRPPFNILPAPLNAMEGSLVITVLGTLPQKNTVLFKTASEVNMAGKTQVLHFILNGEVPFHLVDKKTGAIGLEIDLKKVSLHLPELSKTKLPPQLKPDKRIKNTKTKVVQNQRKIKEKSRQKEVEINLQALGNKALAFKTNLLDEILRLNFDLTIKEDSVKSGYIQVLPLSTTFFKRPIKVQRFKITFKVLIEPQINSQLLFDLPEYKITLKLEGPISDPRQAFSSVPPLPLDDIYSVLLFGRPISGLSDEDKTNAQSAGQILSRGVLSLAVLYYLAGSPVESIGYDPESQEVSAQLGLGSKSSLRIAGEKGDFSSAGVRRSLGKGWYIDTSVQRAPSSSREENFGVLLERIISY